MGIGKGDEGCCLFKLNVDIDGMYDRSVKVERKRGRIDILRVTLEREQRRERKFKNRTE